MQREQFSPMRSQRMRNQCCDRRNPEYRSQQRQLFADSTPRCNEQGTRNKPFPLTVQPGGSAVILKTSNGRQQYPESAERGQTDKAEGVQMQVDALERNPVLGPGPAEQDRDQAQAQRCQRKPVP